MTSNGKLIEWGKLYRAERCTRCYGDGSANRVKDHDVTIKTCPECGGDGVQLIPAGDAITALLTPFLSPQQIEALTGRVFPKS